ncbi:MAG: DUF3179 domain-containing protein [Acidobacteria bacterium]|nr:DUF3179 domain-containing protein [Acidobacteriota bacterium]
MYAREINGQTLTFGVSGMLWRENLVMYDDETNSWWAQASGKAIDGKLKGVTLKMYPGASMMTWKEWRAQHPNTVVLSKQTRRGREGMSGSYNEYHRSSRIGVTGRLRFNDKQLPAKARILGFRVGERAYAVDLAALARKGRITATASDGKKLTIAPTRDGVGGSVYIMGEGVQQSEIPSSVSYWFAWKAFFPETEIIQP